jgi:hypothetical protein
MDADLYCREVSPVQLMSRHAGEYHDVERIYFWLIFPVIVGPQPAYAIDLPFGNGAVIKAAVRTALGQHILVILLLQNG